MDFRALGRREVVREHLPDQGVRESILAGGNRREHAVSDGFSHRTLDDVARERDDAREERELEVVSQQGPRS